MSVALAAGDEAWVLVQTPPTPSGRRTLVGAARVRVEVVAERAIRCVVLRDSGIPVGHPVVAERHELFSCASKTEDEAFGDLVRRMWGPS